MTKKKVHKLFETYIQHKEKINPTIYQSIINKSHYNANNEIFPDLVGKSNYVLEKSEDQFKKSLASLKRSFDIDDVTPAEYVKIKEQIANILSDIEKYESNNQSILEEIAVDIVVTSLNVPESIRFQINGQEPDDFDGEDLLSNFSKQPTTYDYNNTSELSNHNLKIDRCRSNYSTICGAANDIMQKALDYSDQIDDINYKLPKLYQNYLDFNKFNIWVTPDEVLSSTNNISQFKIIEDEAGYLIYVQAPNLLISIYEMAKAILSILFDEKYNNNQVDYDNPWNTRLGSIIWKHLNQQIQDKQKIPYIIDRINQLSDDDYIYVFNEVLANTKHCKDMFSELESEITLP